MAESTPQEQQAPQVVSEALLEAVDSLLETAPCECSHKRRYEAGEHLSHCYLFDLNIARAALSQPAPAVQASAHIAEQAVVGNVWRLVALRVAFNKFPAMPPPEAYDWSPQQLSDWMMNLPQLAYAASPQAAQPTSATGAATVNNDSFSGNS